MLGVVTVEERNEVRGFAKMLTGVKIWPQSVLLTKSVKQMKWWKEVVVELGRFDPPSATHVLMTHPHHMSSNQASETPLEACTRNCCLRK